MDRLRVRLNMYLVAIIIDTTKHRHEGSASDE